MLVYLLANAVQIGASVAGWLVILDYMTQQGVVVAQADAHAAQSALEVPKPPALTLATAAGA
jgi:hypothetical protein